MIRVGMVGVGCISSIYLQNFKNVFHGVKLVAVCDLIRERAEKAKEAYNVPKIYDTMEEMFQDDEIDVILNLTRPYQHYGVTKAALLAGKHVYSEKPLGADLEEGKELVALAEEKGLWLGGAPDTFLGGGIQECRKLIDEGVIGKVVGGRFAFPGHGMETWHPDPDFYYQRGGGPLLDMGPYYVTAMVNLLGGVKEVVGYSNIAYETRLITAKPHEGEIIKVTTPTHYEALITMESGVHVSLMTSFDVWRSRQVPIEIYGTDGAIFVPDPNDFGGKITVFDGKTRTEVEYPITFKYTENSRLLGLADFAAALESGRPGRATHRQTYHVLEVMMGIMQSAKTGLPYQVQSIFTREAPMDPSLPLGVL